MGASGQNTKAKALQRVAWAHCPCFAAAGYFYWHPIRGPFNWLVLPLGLGQAILGGRYCVASRVHLACL
eukprot:10549754-Alexandrium_andersonii.AAC.1